MHERRSIASSHLLQSSTASLQNASNLACLLSCPIHGLAICLFSVALQLNSLHDHELQGPYPASLCSFSTLTSLHWYTG